MRFLALCLIPLASVAAAQGGYDRGPGITPTREGDALRYRADGFSGVGMGFGGTVEVSTGSGFAVRATGPAAALANLRVTRSGDSLNIDHRYRDRRIDAALERQVRFQITMPRISDASVGGSGRMLIDRVGGDSFGGAIGGSGNLQVGTMAVERASISIGGSGGFAGSGTARALEVNIGGSGSVTAPGLRATSASISSAGSGSVRATVNGRASVSVVGSGSVDLGPGATCSVSRVGSGKVRCGK